MRVEGLGFRVRVQQLRVEQLSKKTTHPENPKTLRNKKFIFFIIGRTGKAEGWGRGGGGRGEIHEEMTLSYEEMTLSHEGNDP